MIILFIGFASCKTVKTDQENIAKATYILEYKKAVLYGCINAGTDGNFRKFSLENNDLGLAGVVATLYHSETDKAQEIGAKLSQNIRSIDYADYEGRKPIFDDCVNFAFSPKIDRIAEMQYLQSQRNDGKLSYE